MKNTHLIATLIVLVILGVGYFLYTQTANAPVTEVTASDYTYSNASEDNIVIDQPKPDGKVGASFLMTGKARGTWYFEASFPVVVTEPNGTVLAELPATAQAEWMTTEFVPFSVTVVISNGYTGPATVTLKKDNPSGLPENDASVSFPVVIQ